MNRLSLVLQHTVFLHENLWWLHGSQKSSYNAWTFLILRQTMITDFLFTKILPCLAASFLSSSGLNKLIQFKCFIWLSLYGKIACLAWCTTSKDYSIDVLKITLHNSPARKQTSCCITFITTTRPFNSKYTLGQHDGQSACINFIQTLII